MNILLIFKNGNIRFFEATEIEITISHTIMDGIQPFICINEENRFIFKDIERIILPNYAECPLLDELEAQIILKFKEVNKK